MPRAAYEQVAPQITFAEQMNTAVDGPVVLLNTFVVNPQDVETMLTTWQADALVMKRQPGFISTQLHAAVGASNVVVNYAVFESIEAYRNAWQNPEFQEIIARSPEGAVARPVLLQKVAVPGVCVA